MMREISPNVDIDDDPFGRGGGKILSSLNTGTATSVDGEADGIAPSFGLLWSNEQRAARRLADKLNLFSYQKEALKELVKVDVSLFSMLFV